MSLLTDNAVSIDVDGLPRVNLLPPEIAEGRQFRRIQMALGGAVVGAVGIVALLYISASSGVSSAQSHLTDATNKQVALQSQVAKYRDVTSVYAQAAAAEAMLTQAMGTEVQYSRFLNDLSLAVPENVWLKNVTFTQTSAATPAAPATAATIGTPGIGTVSFTGVGFSHDDVAVWLESLATEKGYSDPYFSGSTEALIGDRTVVNFTSTAKLTSAAYSGRYHQAGG